MQSFPLRERGLKPVRRIRREHAKKVVPLAGTWIETSRNLTSCAISAVVPLAGTWIETEWRGIFAGSYKVVPLAGTWIETGIEEVQYDLVSVVVPLAGTWIETLVLTGKTG